MSPRGPRGNERERGFPSRCCCCCCCCHSRESSGSSYTQQHTTGNFNKEEEGKGFGRNGSYTGRVFGEHNNETAARWWWCRPVVGLVFDGWSSVEYRYVLASAYRREWSRTNQIGIRRWNVPNEARKALQLAGTRKLFPDLFDSIFTSLTSLLIFVWWHCLFITMMCCICKDNIINCRGL